MFALKLFYDFKSSQEEKRLKKKKEEEDIRLIQEQQNAVKVDNKLGVDLKNESRDRDINLKKG